MTKATVDGAVCNCDSGSTKSALLATSSPMCIGDRITASIMDTQFPVPFGRCSKLEAKRGTTPVLCEYAPAGVWMQPLGTIQFGSTSMLGDGAKLNCVHGGVITVLEAGQGVACIWNPSDEKGGRSLLVAGAPVLGTVAVADGPLPFGDILAGGGAIVLGGITVVKAIEGADESEGSWVLVEEDSIDDNENIAQAKKHGNKTVRKSNEARVEAAKERLEKARQELDAANRKPNKTPEDKETVKKAKKAVKKAKDDVAKSEEHARRGQGQP